MIRARAKSIGFSMDELTKEDLLHWFTWELVARGVITLREHNEYWGRHFNLPECCIQFFNYLEENGIEHPSKFMHELFGPEPYHMDYVRCPTCRVLSQARGILNDRLISYGSSRNNISR